MRLLGLALIIAGSAGCAAAAVGADGGSDATEGSDAAIEPPATDAMESTERTDATDFADLVDAADAIDAVDVPDVAAEPDATQLPDLTISAIRRDVNYYYATYCNGGGPSADTFTILFTNVAAGTSFESNYLYPFSVPAPGTCMETGGVTCGLIGDPTCSARVVLRADADDRGTVAESNESNNSLTVTF